MSDTSNKSTLNGLQYLRGIAVMMVVSRHSQDYFHGAVSFPAFGSAGVDIFFAISGFLMAYTVFGPGAVRGSPAAVATDFLWKRVIRIVPLYWLALFFTSRAAVLHLQLDLRFVEDMFFIPHYYLSTHNIWPSLPPGWTINYEMFFYLLFCVSILTGRWALGVVSVAISLLALAGFLFKFDEPVMTFYTADVMLEFVMGILVFVAYSNGIGQGLPRWLLSLVFVVAFAVLFIDNSFPRSFSRGLPAMLIVWVACQIFDGRPIRFLKTLGDASYSIYLFHLASFFFAILIVKVIGFDADPTRHVGAIILIEMIVAALCGIAIYYLVERPVLRWLRGVFERHRHAKPLAE